MILQLTILEFILYEASATIWPRGVVNDNDDIVFASSQNRWR